MNLQALQDGKIYLIDKPLDWTSFDVVNKIKWKIKHHFKVKKIKVGHAGTLDPKATGLLVVCVGRATKSIQEIQDAKKIYTGSIKIGATTPSYDTETDEENIKSISEVSRKDIMNLEQTFKGELMQTPPIYSAIKKDGKRAYDLARKGEDIKLDARPISIDYFKITAIKTPYLHFEVQCSKGTYIRTLANDVGKELGVGAYLKSLRREAIGEYLIENASNDILFDDNYFTESS